eukprot:CAMPEP_0175042856 /NCGR_PEP_ID=MMETSP0052_2-20121109/2823_1 /TAXON_ID=51329 ORGANISM="Polytomella parva, Strain SAG 63-3" /NCGR_SAMPLE_ID=MMETSP0052_2 /ASSEMBLY_ACC=CAM_ASM_000194 /LENGTH=760 /DNA_ID=CAMNT_0016305769 /DNA_START=110 /DNA_END=2389 /DNA_ORIENTATION=-
MSFFYGWPKVLTPGTFSGDKYIYINQTSSFTFAVTTKGVQLWTSGRYRICVGQCMQSEHDLEEEGHNISAIWCSSKSTLAVLTDKNYLHFYAIHVWHEKLLGPFHIVNSSGNVPPALLNAPAADVYLNSVVRIDGDSPSLTLAGDARTLLVGCADGTLVAMSWHGKLREIRYPLEPIEAALDEYTDLPWHAPFLDPACSVSSPSSSFLLASPQLSLLSTPSLLPRPPSSVLSSYGSLTIPDLGGSVDYFLGKGRDERLAEGVNGEARNADGQNKKEGRQEETRRDHASLSPSPTTMRIKTEATPAAVAAATALTQPDGRPASVTSPLSSLFSLPFSSFLPSSSSSPFSPSPSSSPPAPLTANAPSLTRDAKMAGSPQSAPPPPLVTNSLPSFFTAGIFQMDLCVLSRRLVMVLAGGACVLCCIADTGAQPLTETVFEKWIYMPALGRGGEGRGGEGRGGEGRDGEGRDREGREKEGREREGRRNKGKVEKPVRAVIAKIGGASRYLAVGMDDGDVYLYSLFGDYSSSSSSSPFSPPPLAPSSLAPSSLAPPSLTPFPPSDSSLHSRSNFSGSVSNSVNPKRNPKGSFQSAMDLRNGLIPELDPIPESDLTPESDFTPESDPIPVPSPAQPLRILSFKPWGFKPEIVGGVSAMEWAPAATALAVAYAIQGITLWSPGGCRLACTLSQPPPSFPLCPLSPLSQTSPSATPSHPPCGASLRCGYACGSGSENRVFEGAVSAMAWDGSGYRLLVAEACQGGWRG